MRIKVFSLSLSTWYQSQGRKLYSFWFTCVIDSGNPSNDRVSFRSPFPSPKAFRSVISWSENPHHNQHFSDDIFETNHIIRSAKRRSAIFLKAPELKTDPRTIFFRRHKSHAPMHEGAWPTFWCRASTSRLVRRHLALLSLRQSSPNLAFPFFQHFNLRGSSFSLLRPPTIAPFLGQDLCVPWEGLFFISSHFSSLFGSRHTRFFFHSCDPTSL